MEVAAIPDTTPSQHEPIFHSQPEQLGQPPAIELKEPSDFHADLLATQRRERPVRERFQGFGSHEADALIIEAMERSEKKRGNIPPEILIHCTTNSAFLPNVGSLLQESKLGSDEYPNNGIDVDTPFPGQSTKPIHSYFRNPEVMRSIREQQRIETKDFSEFTETDRGVAISWVAAQWVNQRPDLSDETFNRRHSRNARNEARARAREREKSQHDLYRLKRRVEKLETMDASLFRGNTLAEQQRDRAEALKCAGELVNKYDPEEAPPYDEDDYSDQAEYQNIKKEGKKRTNGVNGSRKEREAVTTDNYHDLAEELPEFNQHKHRKRKKKAPAVQTYVYDELSVDPNNDLQDQNKYSRKPKAVTGKRKRTTDSGLGGIDDGDYMDYELVSPVNPTKTYQKKSTLAKPRGLPVPVKSEKSSKLLDAARKYNPNRTARDLNPFGAQMRSGAGPVLSSEFTNFDVPYWLAPPGPRSKLELEMEDPPMTAHTNASYAGHDEGLIKGEGHQLGEEEGLKGTESREGYQEYPHHLVPHESNYEDGYEEEVDHQEKRREKADERLERAVSPQESSDLSPLEDEDDDDDDDDEHERDGLEVEEEEQ